MSAALRAGLIRLEGPRALVRQVPEWIGVSDFAPIRLALAKGGPRSSAPLPS